MRDWKKLTVFDMADRLVMAIYADSANWPKVHVYGLTQQIQRAAVSVASNIVEGCSRSSEIEYIRFLEIAYASSCEVQYQMSVAHRLEFSKNTLALESDAVILSKSMGRLLERLKPRAQSPMTKA